MAEHEGSCCACSGELQSEVREAESEAAAVGMELNAMENDLDDARDMVATLQAVLRDLGPEPDVTYTELQRACAAGAVRLGVDPTPWDGGALRVAGPIACGALGP